MKRNISRAVVRSVLLLILCILLDVNLLQAWSGEGRGPSTGLIVKIDPREPKGKVKVIQATGLKPVNATEEMAVRRGNVLILDPGARAFVLCGDGKTRELFEPGPQPCPCKEPCPPKICGASSDERKMRPTRGPDTAKGLLPVVISPRATLLLNLRPTIRWAPMAGAKESATYKVTVYGENMKVIWSAEAASTTMLAYPDKEPPLRLGETYKVVVTSEGRSSEDDRSPNLGFVTLKKEQAANLAKEEQKIKELRFGERLTRFLLSTLYADEGLYAEAIEHMEDLYNSAKDPVIAGALGDSYAAIGLNREAEKHYLEALQLQDPEDLEGVGLIQKSLAKTYESLGIFDHAVARLDEAIKAYGRLGDSVVVEELKRQREKLLKRNN